MKLTKFLSRTATFMPALAVAAFVIPEGHARQVKPGKDEMQARMQNSTAGTSTVLIPVEGMTCLSCVARIKKALRAVAGVTEVNVSLEKRVAKVTYLKGSTTPEQIAGSISSLGYKTGPFEEEK